MRRIAFVAAVASVLAPALVLAQSPNPRVSLTLRSVTSAEAADALSAASGIPVRLTSPPDPKTAPRADFRWSGISFGQALRAMCAAYKLSSRRVEIGYELSEGISSDTSPMQAVPPRLPVSHKPGLTLIVEDVSWRVAWSRRRFGGADTGEAVLAIRVRCEREDGDAEMLSGFGDVEASDDRGNRSVSLDGGRLFFRRRYQSPPTQAYPDWWTGEIELYGVDPHAHRLAWVEGDLLAYRRFTHTSVELPYTPGKKPVTMRMGGFDVEVESAAPKPPAKAGEPASGPAVEIRMYGAPLEDGTPPLNGGAAAELIGVSGKVYQTTQVSGTGGGDPARPMWKVSAEFPLIDEPIAKVRAGLHAQADPRGWRTFQLRDVPVPPLPPDLPVAPRPGHKPSGRPFTNPAGGELILPVTRAGTAANSATEVIGLSRFIGRVWSPPRWVEADRDGQDQLYIAELSPGRYRVLRSSRAGTPPIEVTIVAGRTTRLPAGTE